MLVIIVFFLLIPCYFNILLHYYQTIFKSIGMYLYNFFESYNQIEAPASMSDYVEDLFFKKGFIFHHFATTFLMLSILLSFLTVFFRQFFYEFIKNKLKVLKEFIKSSDFKELVIVTILTVWEILKDFTVNLVKGAKRLMILFKFKEDNKLLNKNIKKFLVISGGVILILLILFFFIIIVQQLDFDHIMCKYLNLEAPIFNINLKKNIPVSFIFFFWFLFYNFFDILLTNMNFLGNRRLITSWFIVHFLTFFLCFILLFATGSLELDQTLFNMPFDLKPLYNNIGLFVKIKTSLLFYLVLVVFILYNLIHSIFSLYNIYFDYIKNNKIRKIIYFFSIILLTLFFFFIFIKLFIF